MISLQAHNQVLFHLTQLASAINPWSAPLAVKVNTSNKSIHKNAEELYYTSFKEAAKNCTELPVVELNMHCIKSMCRTRENKALSIINQLLANKLEQPSKINYKWKISYVSGVSFAENKQDFPYSQLTKPIILPVVSLPLKQQYRLLHSLIGKTSHSYNTQVRNFKTQRAIQVELDKNRTVANKIKKLMNLFVADSGNKTLFTSDTKETNLEKPKLLFSNDVPPEERERIKTAFVEGYEAGLNRQMRTGRRSPRILISIIFLIGLAAYFWFTDFYKGGGGVFKMSFGTRVEVDPEDVHVTFNDVKGVDEAKKELQDVVEFLKNPDKFTTLGGKLPKGVLLVGPPGTGKTLLARAVAGEAGVPFFHAVGSEFDEILVGQGARRIRDLFKAAKDRAPCVIFIDEIDSVGGTRTNSVLHPYANQTINQLLSEMDGFHQNEGVIVLGATNRREDLDKALMRPGRFDVEIFVKAPDYSGRKEILDLYLGRVLTRNINVEKLARGTTGFTGADLESMINQAALRAAINGADYVTMDHLEYAKDKVLMGPEAKSKIPDEETNIITAFHEGGHTIVAAFTKDADPIHKVTIIPRGPSLGHTSYIPEKDRYLYTKSKLLAQMDTLMGGRAAEELIFGPDRITTGAASDFESATRIAVNMVKQYGMSDKVGFRMHTETKNSFHSQYSPSTNELIDNEIKRLLQESYERAKALLKLHSKELKQLADALLKYETLDAEDVKAITSGKKTKNETNNKIPSLIDVPNANVM